MRRRVLLQTAGASLLPLSWQAAQAQPRYPTKAVRVLVPFAPGQGSDVLARALSDKLSTLWGQPVIVDNKAGANGALAAQEVARAAGDGHTLLLTSNSPIVINPNLYKKLAYNVESDFKPVTLLSTTELALVVTPSLPVKNVADLVAYARANPNKLSFGSPGAGSTSHLMMEAFCHETKTTMVHVPYKGSAPAMTDLMSNTIQLMFDGFPSSVPHVKSGRARAIAVTGRAESRFLPGVPTLSHSGVQGLEIGGWYGLFAPAATDAAIVQKLATDFTATLAQPEFAGRFNSLIMEPAPPMTPAQFTQMVRQETAHWARITRDLGLYQTA